MSEILTYCLGYMHPKCDTCQHEKNWQALNQFDDALRLPLQKAATYINSDVCRMRNMGEHLPVNKEVK